MKFHLIILFTLSINLSFSQSEDLFGVLNDRLISIDPETAEITEITTIDFPTSDFGSDICYSTSTCLFYTFIDRLTEPKLVSFDFEGNGQLIGTFNVSGATISTVEAIAYNTEDDLIYISSSLNGLDFHAESILSVDPLTAQSNLVTTLDYDISDPDADNMCFSGNTLYFVDGRPGGPNASDFYSFDIDQATSMTTPTLIGSTTYQGGADLVLYENDLLYPNLELELVRFDPNTAAASVVGMTHTMDEFGGMRISGIEFVEGLSYPDVQFEDSYFTCPGESIQLELTVEGDCDIVWSTGESGNSILVNELGVYTFEILKDNCTIFSSANITVQSQLDCADDCITQQAKMGVQIKKLGQDIFEFRTIEGMRTHSTFSLIEIKESMNERQLEIKRQYKNKQNQPKFTFDLEKRLKQMKVGSVIKL